MKKRNVEGLAMVVATGLMMCSILFADGGPQHKATPGEAALHRKVMTTFAKALPPGPEGWEKTGGTEITELKLVFAEPNEPFPMTYFVEWQDIQRDKEAQMKLADALAKMDAKSLTEKTLAELQKKLDVPDSKARIEIKANCSSFHWIGEKVNQIPSIGGGLACRNQKPEGPTYIFLGGKWKNNLNSVNFTLEKKPASSTVVNNVVVIVRTNQKRADQLIQGIDWQALNALIQK